MSWSNNEKALVEELNKLAIFKDNPLVVEGKSYAAFDAISDKYVCEFKKRNFESDHKYAIEGLIIEKLKYDSLIKKSKFYNKEALYINKFTDDINHPAPFLALIFFMSWMLTSSFMDVYFNVS